MMSHNYWKLWLLWISVASSMRLLILAYDTGAPAAACITMRPGHGIADPQLSTPPYVIEVDQQHYTPGAVITVTIKGKSDTDVFQGFLVQARRADTSLDTNQLLGSFTEIPAKAQFADCGGNNALTHVDSSTKGLLSFTWTAPANMVGHVVILATILESKNIFWVKVASKVIRDTTAPNITTSLPPLTTIPPTQPAVNITPSAPIVLTDPDVQCGNELGCMRQCGAAGCKFVVAWKPLLDVGRISFFIQARLPATRECYVAVGISEDSEMGMETVFDCIKYRGSIIVQQSYNEGRENHLYPEPMKGLTVLETSIDGDTITCKFERSLDTYKDLRQHWNILVAHGDVNNAGFKVIHSDTRVSIDKVLLTETNYDDVKSWEYTGEGPIGGEESSEDISTTDRPDILTTATGDATAGRSCIHTVVMLLLIVLLT